MPSAAQRGPRRAVTVQRAHGDHLVKEAKAKKPPPEANLEALTRYDAERRRATLTAPKGIGTTRRTKELETLFLESLSQGYSVTASAWTIDLHRQTVYRWRAESEATKQEDGTFKDDFCLRWDSAIECGVDKLEDEARRRAERGVERPVYQGGVMVGTVTEYSDTLMSLLMKGNRPQKFNTERHELSGPNGGAIPTHMELEFIDAPKTTGNRK